MVYLLLANGFEIIEAMSPLDMLRRAGIEVKTVGIGGKTVESSCGVKVEADLTENSVNAASAKALIIPGGMLGVKNLEESEFVQNLVDEAVQSDILVCAICAGPSILGNKGLLNGKTAVCYPGFEHCLKGAEISDDFVVSDGNFITAKGAGVSVEFGLEIVRRIAGEEEAVRIKHSIQCR
ncbi:MAG: DJ-1/PfpI family protein [Clostridiales bacterium]|nr:DJ-1/PfpI family protein [Clostridiales bacterium]